jgi:site-specific DNA recombinase
MEITLIKKQNEKIDRVTGKPIERLRVVAYARVSTDNEEQLNSYESQKKYYKEKIVENPNWYFSGIYADEGISGTQDFKRENFMKMIEDGIKDKYDMILTKSISRFARNTLDTLKYVRLLKEKNVAILFEEENINTLEMSGELLLTVLSSVAQQESETISSHVKLGLKMKSERGELVGFNNCYGYRYDSKTNKMEIIEEEAEIVKFIFQTYISGHGSDYIAKMLTKMNIKTTKTMSTQWSPGTVLGIIKNEKYVGDVIQGKTYTIDPISHKRQRNFGEADQYYIKDHHESIISREDWDKVQSMMKIRAGARENGRRIGNISRKYPFSGKIKCGFCGTTYSRRVMYSKGNSIVIWACIGSVENGKSYCPYSKVFRESLIENAFVDAYQLLCNNKDLNSEMLLNIIAKCSNNNDIERKLTQLENQKLYQETKLNRIVDLMVDGSLPKELFFSKKELIMK